MSTHDLANLRSTLLSPPYNGAIPHELRGTIWLLLLRLRSEHLLAEDANAFAQAARKAVTPANSREQIEKDVQRTRPGLARFKQPAVRGALLRLLSLFCERQSVAYVQGFNELLAPFVLLADTGGNPRIVYALFSEFVARFAPWMLENSESRVFDVLKRLFKYFGRLLLYHDPELYWLLERHMMTPDLYATSWFVTLFARNFTVESVLALWDLLLLEDNPLGTSFFGVALLCSKRDVLLSVDESRIPETLMLLTASSPDEVRKLWKIGSNMRTVHTPPSFQRLMTDRLLSSPSKPTKTAISAARAMQASVCLQTTPDDLLAGDAHYFTWDCRTEGEYNAGHLAQAAHLPLDALRAANGKISSETSEAARQELQTAVDLCEPLKGSTHLCLVGSGVREEDNMDINMLALYLTRIGIPYVSTLRGGFRGALEAVKAGDALSSVELVDYDRKRHERARRDRVSRQLKQEHEAERFAESNASSTSPPVNQTRRDASSAGTPSAQASAEKMNQEPSNSFLQKSDAEVSKAFTKAMGSSGLRYSLSRLSGGLLGDKEGVDSEYSPNSGTSLTSRYNLFSPNLRISPTSSIGTNGTDTPSKQISDGLRRLDAQGTAETPPSMPKVRRSKSSQRTGAQRWATETGSNTVRRNGVASVESSPRLMQTPSNLVSPKPGVPVEASPADVESPIRRKQPSSTTQPQTKTGWGRDAVPGWLGQETLSFPLSSMPKGFTVNVMDDAVMTGLRLFPCKAKSNRPSAFRGRSNEFKKRYVGVSQHYFLLLGPHHNRSHLLEVKVIRYLKDISRITFKRSRPELVTFEVTTGQEGNETVETVECIMPDGLKECVALIKENIGEEEEPVEGGNTPSPKKANTDAAGERYRNSTSDSVKKQSNVDIPGKKPRENESEMGPKTSKMSTSQETKPRKGSHVSKATRTTPGISVTLPETSSTKGSEDDEFGDFQSAPPYPESPV